jgi:arylsulfatase A-like enzyme
MTGQHTGHTRVRGNAGIVGGVGPQRRVPLEPDDVTVAEVLKAAGYVTGITGKWGLGEPDTAGVPTRQGFDEWFGYLNQQHAHNYYPDYLWHNETKVELAENAGGKQGKYSHDLFTTFALDFVRKHHARPFFLYLAWTIPHGRYMIPSLEPYAERPWDHDYKVHAAMVTRMDGDVGRLMALLKELQIDDRTLVFFCSDNGAVQRREGVLDSAGPFRGQKGTQYEGGLRTPMIVRWPGQVPAGKLSAAPWYFADVLPTLAEVAGARPPAHLDGVSVLPTLLGRPQDLGQRRMYWEQYSGGFQQAVRWGKWKAHRRPSGALELYDLSVDVAEKDNVAGRHPEVVQRLAAFLKEAHTDSPNWPVDRKARP